MRRMRAWPGKSLSRSIQKMPPLSGGGLSSRSIGGAQSAMNWLMNSSSAAENEAGCAAADSKMPIYIRRMPACLWGSGKSSRPSHRAVQNAECSSCQRPGAGGAAIKWVIRTCQPIVCMARRSDVWGRRDEPGPSGSNSSARVLK